MTAPESSSPAMTSQSTTQVTVLTPEIPVNFHGGPDPMFTSLDNANLMGVLCFSVILGLVLSAFRDEQNVVLHVFVCLSNTLMTATHMLLWFAPVGLCSASVSLVLQGAAELQALTGDLSMYVMAFLAAVALHGLLVLPTLYLFLTHRQLGPFFRNMVYPLSVALGTSSRCCMALSFM
nr:excitatory amino acid transporter 4-like [Rhipicephalus microplus]